jgi:hypothetical protein
LKTLTLFSLNKADYIKMLKSDTKTSNGNSGKQKKEKPNAAVNKYEILTNKKRKVTETQSDSGILFRINLIRLNFKIKICYRRG